MSTAQQRYEQLQQARSPFLQRAREAAELTLPTLLPPSGHSATNTLPTPYQSLGARGVNNLAAKLLLTLLPPNTPFFRLEIDDFSLKELTDQDGMRAEVEKGLNRVERAIQSKIETGALRVSVFEALKHLLVAGNCLLYLPKDGGARLFQLPRYVVQRDPMGHVLQIVIKECVAPTTLPERVRATLAETPPAMPPAGGGERTLDLYTVVERVDTQWHYWQEIKGREVPGSRGRVPLEKSPWIPLRYSRIDGEDYGRGLVEEYLGDLSSLEDLSKAVVEGAAQAARVLYMVNPNGVTDEKDVAEADNGAVIAGRADDVDVLQLAKFADFRTAGEAVEGLKRDLSFSFLLNTAIQRNGERVTASEIRYMANELEDALGGVYSILSQELQLPLVQRLMYQMERAGELPPLPKGIIRPAIVTGLEALGRGHDLDKLTLFTEQLTRLGAGVAETYLNIGDYITRIGTSLGVDMDGLIKSAEEIQQQQQQQQMQALSERLGPNLVNQLTPLLAHTPPPESA